MVYGAAESDRQCVCVKGTGNSWHTCAEAWVADQLQGCVAGWAAAHGGAGPLVLADTDLLDEVSGQVMTAAVLLLILHFSCCCCFSKIVLA